ncbi:hypothetical protein [Fodinicola feengrottensis]|uniref:hypothetical protein n=1 Tax=Fodinicola feengrottensis TaxID=435914 RepID=UPI0013D2DBF9|nr:hypothetical protein [Fodinicola feengrottensis]
MAPDDEYWAVRRRYGYVCEGCVGRLQRLMSLPSWMADVALAVGLFALFGLLLLVFAGTGAAGELTRNIPLAVAVCAAGGWSRSPCDAGCGSRRWRWRS